MNLLSKQDAKGLKLKEIIEKQNQHFSEHNLCNLPTIFICGFQFYNLTYAFLSFSYCGYCPQFKYKIKDTFGKTTHDLLTEPGISRSTRPVLLHLENEYLKKKRMDVEKQHLVRSRGRSIGEQKYGSIMVPGYTGEKNILLI